MPAAVDLFSLKNISKFSPREGEDWYFSKIQACLKVCYEVLIIEKPFLAPKKILGPKKIVGPKNIFGTNKIKIKD